MDFAEEIVRCRAWDVRERHLSFSRAAQSLRDERDRAAKIVENHRLTAPAIISEAARAALAKAIRNEDNE